MEERIAGSILECIGRTPLVRIRGTEEGGAEVLAKPEGMNPGGSSKDRAALSMVEAAEASGALRPGGTIVEPTSGNSGIGLAMVAAVKKYRLVLTMPATMSVERQQALAAYGAEVVLTPGTAGMAGAIARAKEIAEKEPGAWMPGQFDNPANPEAHYRTTAEEILKDCGGRVDAFVAGVGTGGTISGVGRRLKEAAPGVKVVAVEPEESAVLSGKNPGSHRLQGIGAGFVPSIFDWNVVDRIFTVGAEAAGRTTLWLAREHGILAGISSGAAAYAAMTMAQWEGYEGKRIVALFPDTGSRYLSGWPFRRG